LDPYNSGHFDVIVKLISDNTETYEISDNYEFGYIANDKSQKGRHVFPLGVISEWKLENARRLLP
jgi:hypothetical protein